MAEGVVLFAAGDPGGSRAVLPCVLYAAHRGVTCHVRRHGFLGREISAGAGIVVDDEDAPLPENCRCYVYGSSATDAYALRTARDARELGIPTIHICDNWSAYRKRVSLDGSLVLPDIYCVMDESAREDAVAEGIPASCCVVTGQPALAGIRASWARSPLLERRAHPLLVFVSEPYRAVMGRDVTVPGHCGFTEYEVLENTAKVLAATAPEAEVLVLPHPKHAPGEMEALWAACRCGLAGEVVRGEDSRAVCSAADGIIGMASILLYEAWLMGRPCLAVQAGSRLPGLRRFSRLSGIHYVDAWPALPAALSGFLKECNNAALQSPRPEYRRHVKACGCFFNLLRLFL